MRPLFVSKLYKIKNNAKKKEYIYIYIYIYIHTFFWKNLQKKLIF